MVGRVGAKEAAAESYPALAGGLEHLPRGQAVADRDDVPRAASGASFRVRGLHDHLDDKGPERDSPGRLG
jgi:hypothetical protein